MSEEGVERKLTTILAADVVGYSRLMAADEAGTLTSLKAVRREIIEPKTTEHHGRVVKLIGDGTLMEFGSVVDAIRFAADVQQALAERNAKVPEDRRIIYRIGINIGDIIVEGDDIYGDGVNIAARLEGLAEPGGICVASNVFNQVKAKVEVGFEDLGAQNVKNIPEPVQVFKVLLDSPARDHADVVVPAATGSRRWPLVAGGLALIVIAAGIALWQRPWAPREEPALVENMAFPLPDKPSIAVLPFDNMSGDPKQEYFADGTGLINLDFADIRAVMTEMGKAMMGTGEAEGENRALTAAEAAISNPLLDNISMKGARGVLINITGGMDLTLFEVDEAANRIRDEVDTEANIIFGSTLDQSLKGRMRVSVVATGHPAAEVQQSQPTALGLIVSGRAREWATEAASQRAAVSRQAAAR